MSRKLQTFLSTATRRKGFQYVLIPEYHKRKKGEDKPALHICNLGAVQIERALSENGRGLTDDEGRPVYNVLDWKWGFSTCVPPPGWPGQLRWRGSHADFHREGPQ